MGSVILEGEGFFGTCLLGLPGCGEFAPCPVHDFWSKVRGDMQKEFEVTTLAEMAKKIQDDRLRLTP